MTRYRALKSRFFTYARFILVKVAIFHVYVLARPFQKALVYNPTVSGDHTRKEPYGRLT